MGAEGGAAVACSGVEASVWHAVIIMRAQRSDGGTGLRGGGCAKDVKDASSCAAVLVWQAAEQTLEWCWRRGEDSAAAVGLQHKNAVDELKFLREKVGNNVVAAT